MRYAAGREVGSFGWLVAVTIGVAAALGAPGLARAQWPHLAGKPIRSAPIVTDADGSVYVVNPDSDSVTRLAPAAGGAQAKTWEAPAGDYPRTLTLWGDTVITANQHADTISHLARGDGAPVGPDVGLGFGCTPYGVVGNHAGDRLYVSCEGTQEVVVLDASLAIVTRIQLSWPTPRALVINGDDTRLYVSHFLTVEPNNDAHVSEIDTATNALTQRRALTVPADRRTCETQNSGQGVTNLVTAIALTPPDSPVAGQLWVGGTMQGNLTKGLFRRYAGFKDDPRGRIFDLPCPEDDLDVSCMFESFPRGNSTAALKRNLYKSSFHDITRFVIWKVDLASGQVVGKIDVDEANHATDFAFSEDGTIAYVVDQIFNSFHVFNARRGQDGNASTLFASVAQFGAFGADPSRPCDADALGSVTSERPFIQGFEPQAQITPIDGGDPVRIDGTGAAHPVNTGVEFDVRAYHERSEALMRPVPDAVGTAPIGVALSPDGCIVYVANYLARNVVALSARPGVPTCSSGGQTVDFRCARDAGVSCRTVLDCPAAGGVCNHPGGAACSNDADCPPGMGPCIRDNECTPLVVADPVQTTAVVSEEIPAEILDGKILFNTAARDGSVPNGIGLDKAAPLYNDVRHACSTDRSVACNSDADCAPGTCEMVSLPGEVVSTSHDASYVSCTACHADYGGQDGRTWDFSQFGASLRNTMDLRGRSQAAPGTCAAGLSSNATRVGGACHFDAECGTGSGPGACVGDPSMTPPHLSGAAARRYFNPMISVHWNGDRMEVEAFEFTYRSLLGSGDCDGTEHDPSRCLGALLPRSLSTSTAIIPTAGGLFENDLRSTLRNIMVAEPTLGKDVNASLRLTHMADFVYSLTKFPRNPFLGENGAALTPAARRGRLIFNDGTTKCGSCHNGPSAQNQLFTDKRPNPGFDPGQPAGAATNNVYVRHVVGTANLFDEKDPDDVADEIDSYQNSVGSTQGRGIPASRGPLRDYVTPPLTDVWNTAPFLHDGSAPKLLDVVRPCATALADCNQRGLGRNIDDLHGVTSVLTPQQLNDLVAFQLAPHNPVGATEAVVRAGELRLKTLAVKFGKRAGRGTFSLVATVVVGGLAFDPVTDGLGLTLAVPDGHFMALYDVTAPSGAVRGRSGGARFRYKSAGVELSLKRQRGGDFQLVVTGRKADLDVLDNGATDVTVALFTGPADAPVSQFVQNRLLKAKQRVRGLVLPKGRGA